MYHFELNDILFFINSIKNPSRSFNILHYLHFTKGNTRSKSYSKLVHSSTPTNTGSQFYFIRFPRLWNSIPPLDLTLSVNTLKNTIINLFWSNFSANFDSSNPCSYHYLCPCSKYSSTPSPPIFHDCKTMNNNNNNNNSAIHDFMQALSYSAISLNQADGFVGKLFRKYIPLARNMPTR